MAAALLCSCSPPLPSSHRTSKSSIAKTLIITPLTFIKLSSVPRISLFLNLRYHPLPAISCSSSSTSLRGPDQYSVTIIFIKGLSQSTSEGYLKKEFSQFGEVSRVKIVTDKKTKQSLGFAYVWFGREESAQLAVKEMDGKFLDGRFIHVSIAKPGSCKTQTRVAPYKF